MDLEQITKTGITGDYWNCYFAIAARLKTRGKESASEALRRFPIPRYDERYSESIYPNLFVEEVLPSIRRLNELADIVNQRFISPDNYETEEFKVVINEVHRLIYDREKPYFPEVERIT